MNDQPSDRDRRRPDAEQRYGALKGRPVIVSGPAGAIASLAAGGLILANVDVLEVVLPLYLIVNGVIGLAERYF